MYGESNPVSEGTTALRRVFLLPPPGTNATEPIVGSDDLANRRLLFIVSRDDGFSNQRITVAEGLRCSKLLGRVAVLPPVFANVRYGAKPMGPYLFRDYFDLEALAAANAFSFATPGAVAKAAIKCDILNDPNAPKRVLSTFETQYGWKRRNTPLSQIPTDAKCITQASCRTDWRNPAHFGEYSNFSTFGQGYNVLESQNFREVRSALRPSRIVLELAHVFLNKLGSTFNAIHLRRTDFKAKCKSMPDECAVYGENAFVASEDAILSRVMGLPNPRLPLFVATEDPKFVHDTLAPTLREKGVSTVLAQDIPLPHHLMQYRDRVDMLSFATQIAAGRAETFVGNRFSSFSSEIFNERLLGNRTSEKLFF